MASNSNTICFHLEELKYKVESPKFDPRYFSVMDWDWCLVLLNSLFNSGFTEIQLLKVESYIVYTTKQKFFIQNNTY